MWDFEYYAQLPIRAIELNRNILGIGVDELWELSPATPEHVAFVAYSTQYPPPMDGREI